MFDMMQDMKRDMGQTKLVAETARETAEMAMKSVTEVKTSIKSINTTLTDLKNRGNQFEKDVYNMRSQLQHPRDVPIGDKRAAEDVERDLQVIVEGLKEPQDEKDIITQVATVVEGLGYKSKCTIKTFVDPSKIAVIEFTSIASEIGFLRKTNSADTMWTNGQDMRFKNNDTIAKQISDKALGFIEHHLQEVKKLPLNQVSIK